MTTNMPSAMVPKLRFPEFRNAGDWMTKTLGNQGGFLTSLTGKAAKDFDTGDAAFIPYMNVFSNPFTDIFNLRSVNVGSDESQNAVSKGDVFFTISSETPEEAGMSSVLLEEVDNCYLNSFCALFRFGDGKSPSPVFLGYLLRSALARAHLSRGAQGATRYNISKETFRSLPLQLPSRPEQQKIADCLSSLDDLIAAEGRKVEALRQHKQGLMQQLFPQPGETVPRLRFPEFRDGPRWDLLTLSSASDVNPSNDGLPESFIYIDLESVKSSMLIERKEITRDAAPSRAQRLLNRRDIIYQTVRPYQRNNFFFDINDEYDYVASTGYAQIRAHECPEFLYHLLHTNPFVNSVLARCTGSNYPAINPSALASIPVALPRETEQQKIAHCLSSHDAQIASQVQKIRSLKTHKQGLLQQLFPSLEGH